MSGESRGSRQSKKRWARQLCLKVLSTCRGTRTIWSGCVISCLLQVEDMERDLEGREGRIEELKKKYVVHYWH